MVISISYPSPKLLTISAYVPTHFNYPLTYIANLYDKASASSIEWVVNKTQEFLSFAEELITSHIFLLGAGSIPVDGSSNKITYGLPNIVIATDNFLLLPPL